MREAALWVMILTHAQAEAQQHQRRQKKWSQKKTLTGVQKQHPQAQQKAFHVSIVADPLAAAARHNQRISQATDMHGVAPFSYPIRIIGPFVTVERAQRFAHTLIQGTRGLASLCRRLLVVLQLPVFNDLQCYNRDISWSSEMDNKRKKRRPVSLAHYLSRHGAPAHYVEVAQRLDDAAQALAGTGMDEAT